MQQLDLSKSKLAKQETTIFSKMSSLAQRYQAINLSQGFPDFNGPDYLQERLSFHVKQGANQYATMQGMLELRTEIRVKTERCYQFSPCPEDEITITSGATEALYAAITALVQPGDEVVCFQPCYDSYAPAIALSGGVFVPVLLKPPHFLPDWAAFQAVISDKTRLVIINSPHNPTATVWTHQDYQTLWQTISNRKIWVLSDEVYEHIHFQPSGHQSLLQHPNLRQRGIVVSSFGKTYHMTGWRVGYCIAPKTVTKEIRKIHQYLTFSVNTPAQLALADMLAHSPDHYATLADFYQKKRDYLSSALQKSRFEILPCSGTYFLLLDYRAISSLDDVSFCEWLTREVGVAAIPLSVFCDKPFTHSLIRVCFAKKQPTLKQAAERLCRL